MPNPNTLTQLEKSIILQHKEYLLALRLFRVMKDFLKGLGIKEIDPNILYDLLYDSELKNCKNSKFVSFSVGYRSCKKGCECYVKNLSSKMSNIKNSLSENEKTQILQTRQKTVNEKYGVSNVSKLETVKEKIKSTKKLNHGDENYRNSDQIIQTNLQKYGVDNPMKAESIRESYYSRFYSRDFKTIAQRVKSTKKLNHGDENYRNSDQIIQTNLQKYGVDNPAKSTLIKNKISKNLRNILYDRTLDRYGEFIKPLFTKEQYLNGQDDLWQCVKCDNQLRGSIINGIIPRCTVCFPYSVSNFEIEVRNFLKTLVDSDKLIFNDRNIISPRELDIVIPEKKLAFECNGVYRHTEVSGLKPRLYHREKTLKAAQLGYSLMHILDIDWYSNPHIIKSMIKNKLGLSKKIGARKTTLRELSHAESTKFFEFNHLQGSVPSKISLGLIFNGEIVAAMSFSKSRYSKNASWEIIRFCNKIDYSVIGAASKFISYFRKKYAGSIVSYSDQSYGTMGFYQKIGFELVGVTSPGYRYFKNGKLFSRVLFQKHKLPDLLDNFDQNKSEWENMQANDFDRLWDCGNQIFLLK